MKVDVQFPAVVGPRPELEVADLDIEREVLDVDGAGGSKDGGREPEHVASVADDSHSIAVLLQTSVGAATGTENPPSSSSSSSLSEGRVPYSMKSVGGELLSLP